MKTALLFFLTLLPVAGWPQDSLASRYKIYSTARRQLVTIDEVVNRMKDADVLFFGEEHNDSAGHYLERAIFEKMAVQFPGMVALSMEMFETDCQTVLDEYLAGLIREKNFLVDARAWPNYKDYRPLGPTMTNLCK